MSRKYTLSVVMPNYNDAKYISTAIEAVLGQTYQPDEFIICDDNSTDNSAEIIAAYARRYPVIKFIKNETNMGNVSIVNRLIETARGDYIYAAASDDYIMPGFLEQSMNMLSKYPDAGYCATYVYNITEKGRKIGIGYMPGMPKKACFMGPEEIFQRVCRVGSPEMFSTNTMVYKRRYLIDCGGYPLKIKYFHDVALGSVVAARHGACLIPEPLTCVRQKMDSYSASFFNNYELFTMAVEAAAEYMRQVYSDSLPVSYIRAFEANMKYDAYFYTMAAARKSTLKRYRAMRLTPIGRPLYLIIKTFLYGRDAVKCLHYLSTHKLNIVQYARNYLDTVLYMRRQRFD
ncbi:MAG: glycosyltransferase family 2 protein [Candidatus Magnetominusculus sp. LBB02]|nr:glycosyltransferase family 2 protein [Candidatus Magnetominusculus sp. LBB02]